MLQLLSQTNMALFGSKKDKKEESAKAPATEKKVGPKPLATDHNLASVIVAPRITEKAVGLSEQNVYTFVVHANATKFAVRDAIKALYNVTPVKVNIVNKAPRKVMSRSKGRKISEQGMKKAYVYLKKGDSISLV